MIRLQPKESGFEGALSCVKCIVTYLETNIIILPHLLAQSHAQCCVASCSLGGRSRICKGGG